MAEMTPDELRQNIIETFLSLDPQTREQMADVFAAAFFDAQRSRAQSDTHQHQYPHRILDDGGAVTTQDDGTLAALNTTSLFDTLNFINGQVSINEDNRRQADIRINGAGVTCYHYLVAACWADEVTAGRHTEGEVVTLFTSCTTRIYSTVGGALAHAATGGIGSVIIGICPDDYVEELAWPTNSATLKAVHLFGIGPAPTGTDSNVGCVRIGGTTVGVEGIEITTNPCNMTLTNMVIRGHTDSIQFTSGTGGRCVWQNVRFTGRVEMDGFQNVGAYETYFDGGVYAVGSAFDDGGIRFFGCRGTVVDFSLAANVEVMLMDGCDFTSVTARNPHDFEIRGGEYTGTNNVVKITSNSTPTMRIVIDTHFSSAPVTTGAIVDISTLAGSTAIRGLRICSTFTAPQSAVSATTCYIRLTGLTADKIYNPVIMGNSFGQSSTAGTSTIEDRGGVSVIADYVEGGVFGPNAPAGEALYSLTNYTLPMVNGILWGSGAPTHTDNYAQLYKDTATDTFYSQNTDPTGNSWGIIGVSGGGAAAPSPHNLVSVHHDGEQDYTNTLNLLGLAVSTGDLIIYSDAGVTETARWDGPTGHIGIGTGGISAARIIDLSKTIASGNAKGINLDLTASAASAGGRVAGFELQLDGPSSGSQGSVVGAYVQIGQLGTAAVAGIAGYQVVFSSDVAGSIAGATAFEALAPSWGVVPTTIYAFRAGDIGGTGATVYPIYVPTQTGTAIHSVHEPALRIGSVSAPTNVTAGDLTATRLIVPNATILHSAISQLGGPVVIPTNGSVLFSDADDSHYTGLRGPATSQTENYIYVLPADDPANGEVLSILNTAASPVITTEWAAAGAAATPITFPEAAAPSTPAADAVVLYNLTNSDALAMLDDTAAVWKLSHLHSWMGMVDGVIASTTVPYARVGPMPEPGVIVSVASFTQQDRAIGATAWIGDIHKMTLANANTTTHTTIFTTKPTITNGNYYQLYGAPDLVTTFAAGDFFLFFSDQAGTSAPFIGMTMKVRYTL